MSSGDIVRHEDYPQWGRGYVIRAGKSASDIFFLWGGKRRIDVAEPLRPSPARGLEAEFFDVCAGLSSRSLETVNSNSGRGRDLRYQLNFVDGQGMPSNCDPVIRNDGGKV